MSATIRSLLTLLFGWLMMEGHLNFGSGKKDVFQVLSASVATAGLVVAWLRLPQRATAAVERLWC